jgi:hypothetical protein
MVVRSTPLGRQLALDRAARPPAPSQGRDPSLGIARVVDETDPEGLGDHLVDQGVELGGILPAQSAAFLDLAPEHSPQILG